MAPCEIRIDASSGKSIRSLLAICSGLQDLAQRRSRRRPWRRPIQRTSGPDTAVPSGVVMVPASRSCTYWRNASFAASFATFGRLARRSACHWAAVARYSRCPLRVAAADLVDRQTLDAMQPTDLCPHLHVEHFLPGRGSGQGPFIHTFSGGPKSKRVRSAPLIRGRFSRRRQHPPARPVGSFAP